MANTILTRTPSTAGNRRTWTFSAWIKRSKISATQVIFVGASPNTWIRFQGADALEVFAQEDFKLDVVTDMLFRDTSAWYHICVAVDMTQASQSNRVKIYVNGSLVGVTVNYAVQNYDTGINNTGTHYFGRLNYTAVQYFDGSMSHIHLIDGTAYDATAFGQYDANGVWTIKTSPSVTYGTNGFFILKDGNSVTDQSGNSNNFTVGGGTLTNTEDNPSNVFATMNPLSSYYFGGTFSNGNNKIVTNAGNESYAITTLGVSSGKYYWEVKDLGTQNYEFIGIVDQAASATAYAGYTSSNAISYYSRTGGYVINGGASQTYGNAYGTNDIIGLALDLDNNKLYFSKNGTFQNSGDPTSGATGTGAISIGSTPSDGVWYAQAGEIYTGSSTFEFNFGNGYFGTTAVSSAGTNASGNGIFEYDVPTGYTALSTKGLNL